MHCAKSLLKHGKALNTLKKLLKSAAAILLAAISAFSLPFSTAAATKGNSPYTGQPYTHASRFDGCRIYNGIDVSTHNGNIDWKSVKASGVDYAIIRLGYTGYSRERFSARYDTAFEANISGARAAGLPVGVYWYSQAVNTSEARQEAQKLLAKLRSYSIDLPVFMITNLPESAMKAGLITPGAAAR